MSESITVSLENKQCLDLLKKPGESYDDVLAYLLEDYKIDYSGWNERADEALAEHRRGESISFGDIKKKYGVE